MGATLSAERSSSPWCKSGFLKEKGCVIHSDHPYNAPMAMGRREQQRQQEEFWIAHTELPRTAAHPFYEQLNSFVLHSLAFLLKPHCEAAADSDQLRLSFFHCSAPILCRSSLCVPKYRTIRSPAVLPGSIGWSTATTSYAFQTLFASATHPFAQVSKSWTATPGCLAPGRRWPVAGSRTSRLS